MRTEVINIGTREELDELLVNSPGYREMSNWKLSEQFDKLEKTDTKTGLLFTMRDDIEAKVTHIDKWWVCIQSKDVVDPVEAIS